jgi:DHA1 family bicyclomycin/chloramphenicol resistance-like MFS transporter
MLPETLHPSQVQRFEARHLLRGYAMMVTSPQFMALVLASAVPFNAMFLYVLTAPAFLGGLLALRPTQFFWFFFVSIAGIMGGAAVSGRVAGRITAQRQITFGFALMALATLANVALAALLPPNPLWNIPPVALISFGWSLLTPAVTLLVLDRVPDRRGMASSVQSSVGSVANGVVAGVLAPLVMHSLPALALTSATMLVVGLVSWLWVHGRLA